MMNLFVGPGLARTLGEARADGVTVAEPPRHFSQFGPGPSSRFNAARPAVRPDRLPRIMPYHYARWLLYQVVLLDERSE